jgi:hypothetical protein
MLLPVRNFAGGLPGPILVISVKCVMPRLRLGLLVDVDWLSFEMVEEEFFGNF